MCTHAKDEQVFRENKSLCWYRATCQTKTKNSKKKSEHEQARNSFFFFKAYLARSIKHALINGIICLDIKLYFNPVLHIWKHAPSDAGLADDSFTFIGARIYLQLRTCMSFPICSVAQTEVAQNWPLIKSRARQIFGWVTHWDLFGFEQL